MRYADGMERRAVSPPGRRPPATAPGRGRGVRRFAFAAAAAFALSGCSSMADMGLDFGFLSDWFGGHGARNGAGAAMSDTNGPERPSLAEMAATEPRFAVGDSFTFDNPRATWTVKEVGEDRIRWVADNGDEQVTDTNPLLPALAWRSEGQGEGRRRISGMNQPFFPLEPGKHITFESTVSSDQPPFAWEFTWSCDVLGTERVETPAGRFGTYKIACGRKRPDELTFYYAPAVGHYVRMVNVPEPGGKRIARDLVDFRSRQHMAFVDPKTSAMADGGADVAGEGGEIAELPPASLQTRGGTDAGASDGGASGEGALADPSLPEMDNPMDRDKPDPRFAIDGPVLIMGEGNTPQSGLTPDGANKSRESAMSTAPTPRDRDGDETSGDGGTAAEEPAAGSGDGEAPTQTASAAAALPEGMTPATDLGEGAVALHVASYKNPDNVETGWRRLKAANGDLLGNVRPIVRKVTLPEKGVFFRLLVGPVASMSDAEALCAALDSRDVYCDPMTL